jgi:hydroxylamine reductase
MFCYHCQEAKKNKVCDTAGICGKKANISSLQDLLMYSLKGLAFYAVRAAEFNLVSRKTDRFMAKALFSMVTNVNFAASDFVELIDEAVRRRDSIGYQFLSAFKEKYGQDFAESLPEEALWQYDKADEAAFTEKGEQVGVLYYLEKYSLDADVHALQECLLYAAKGLASLAVHNLELGVENDKQYRFLYQALDFTLKADNTQAQVFDELLESGRLGLEAMHTLERGNAEHFGEPEPTTVYLDCWDNPGILVSGHDLQDLEDLLVQAEGSGVDIYTHDEAIAAHGYPSLRKFFGLVGNYGGAWQEQKTQFPKFSGPILVTSNSIQQPKKTYQEKLFTTGMVGWPDVPHIADRKPGQRKDFSTLIELAKSCPPPEPLTSGTHTVGYGLNALKALLPAIVEAISSQQIQRIIVLAGTDGRHKERRYYSELVEKLPENTLVLTAGDVKYRFLSQDLGQIGTIPRLLDCGQSYDFNIILEFLQALQQALKLDDFNQLPVSFNIAWYEQKTILIMLALFARNIQHVRVGPTLPPFFTADILAMLAEKYQFKGIDTVENDIAAMLDGQ